MRPVGTDVLTVRFEGWVDLSAQRAHLERAGLFVPVPDPLPEPFSELTVRVVAPDGQQVELEARVVQIAPQAGVALALSDAGRAQAALAPMLEAAALAVASGQNAGAQQVIVAWAQEDAAAVPRGDGEAEAAPGAGSQARGGAAGEEDAATLHERVRGLSTAEKMRTARHGDRAERLILMKDPNKTIQLHLIQNKRITIDEVRYLAAYRQANPEVLSRIAESREWMQHPGIVTALVNNPKTPSRIAVRLLRNLPQSELRRIAKSPNSPRAVAMAARKILASK